MNSTLEMKFFLLELGTQTIPQIIVMFSIVGIIFLCFNTGGSELTKEVPDSLYIAKMNAGERYKAIEAWKKQHTKHTSTTEGQKVVNFLVIVGIIGGACMFLYGVSDN